MSSIYLFDVASQRSNWLSLRQETVSGNISHANTPGYTARDVQPFEEVLQSVRPTLATSDPAHMKYASGPAGTIARDDENAWHVFNSGNSVSLEKEVVKSGEINSAFALNTSVVKAFHRMLLTSAKG